MASRTKNVSRSIFYGFINNTISILFPFLTRTMLIYVLGIQYVGLSSLFTSLLTVLSITEAGIGNALVYKMYKPIAEGNVKKVNALYNFYKKCYRTVGIIVLILGLLLMPFLRFFVKSDLPADVNLYVLYIIYLLNTVLSYYLFAYKNSLLVAHQRNDVNNIICAVTCATKHSLELLLLFFFRSYYVYAVMLPITTIFTNLIRAYYVDQMFPQYVCEGRIDIEEVSSLKKQVGGLVFQKIGGIVLSNVDPIVISAFLGLAILGKYNNYNYIITALFGILGMVTNSLVPSVGNTVFTKDKQGILADFRKITFLFLLICSWFCTCYMCLIQPFIEMWIGTKYQFDIKIVVLLAAYLYIAKMNDICWVYREAAGFWWEGKMIPLTAAILNLTVNIILVQYIGIAGVIISTLVSMMFVYLPGGSYVLFHYLFQDMKAWRYYIKQHVYYACCACVAAGVTYAVCSWINGNVWLVLLMRSVVCVVLPVPIFCTLNVRNPSFIMAKEFVKEMLRKGHMVKR